MLENPVLAERVATLAQQLLERDARLATAESCTGGWVAANSSAVRSAKGPTPSQKLWRPSDASALCRAMSARFWNPTPSV